MKNPQPDLIKLTIEINVLFKKIIEQLEKHEMEIANSYLKQRFQLQKHLLSRVNTEPASIQMLKNTLAEDEKIIQKMFCAQKEIKASLLKMDMLEKYSNFNQERY